MQFLCSVLEHKLLQMTATVITMTENAEDTAEDTMFFHIHTFYFCTSPAMFNALAIY